MIQTTIPVEEALMYTCPFYAPYCRSWCVPITTKSILVGYRIQSKKRETIHPVKHCTLTLFTAIPLIELAARAWSCRVPKTSSQMLDRILEVYPLMSDVIMFMAGYMLPFDYFVWKQR